jgi:hypothetical protein
MLYLASRRPFRGGGGAFYRNAILAMSFYWKIQCVCLFDEMLKSGKWIFVFHRGKRLVIDLLKWEVCFLSLMLDFVQKFLLH